ncbi:hypothetical protein L3Q65_00590 (plasmid) [Amycolatopsis sp. FU40]|uniref:ParB/RepB/Spo0J family partition protein n=1 Tax=Amycolatopsis sp. FU40 TaxID=2914159 RepID=UPI001F25925F|nr:hypothetical protein [Amycolatopsis sp. FU40]UKD50826.1 hypothetical protein L3Q65_00590 [Amycolatopsis sp. FU40]
MPKDFAKKDVHRADDTRAAFRRRYDDSRTNLFDLDLDTAIPNPFNPRYPDDPDVIETAGSLREVGQLQPVVVVTRDAFIEAYPELDGDEERLPAYKVNKQGKKVAVTRVIVIGNRRYEGALLNEWTKLDAVLAPSVATAADIEDRILHENIHRQQLPPLLEAQLLQRKMQRENLSLRQVAKKISKTHTYVDSRLDLMKLIPEFQGLMQREFPMASSERTLKLKLARDIAKLPKTRQREIWEQGAPFHVAVIPDYSTAPASATADPATAAAAVSPAPAAQANNAPTGGSDERAATVPPPPPSPESAAPAAGSSAGEPAAARSSDTEAPPSTPAPEATAEPEATLAADSTERSAPEQRWPLALEATDLNDLASALGEKLSEDEVAQLVELLI